MRSTPSSTSSRFLSTPSARRATSAVEAVKGGLQFLSTPSARRATKIAGPYDNILVFLSTPSARRATGGRSGLFVEAVHFYPRPPRGGRPPPAPHQPRRIQFLSTPSARRATAQFCSNCGASLFLSTPSARRATCSQFIGHKARNISIHALREEGDQTFTWSSGVVARFLSTPSARRATFRCPASPSSTSISIHALREEGDRGTRARVAGIVDFYPRPPRGGRPCRWRTRRGRRYFYPRPPRGGRREVLLHPEAVVDFYPRPPRGGRPICTGRSYLNTYFYPRPPRGGRLTGLDGIARTIDISIHALREEGDHQQRGCLSLLQYFYPRPPRGGRRISCLSVALIDVFLSTPSARRATAKPDFCSAVVVDFYPRPPRGGRPANHQAISCGCTISIHALREEGDPITLSRLWL